MNKVANLGIGARGERMARNRLRAGYQLAVLDHSNSKTATLRSGSAAVFDRPREAATASDIVKSMATDDTASRAVWLDGAPASARKG